MAEALVRNPAFEPVTVARDIQSLTRPSLSYWQDAWRRLRSNRRAFVSLYIVGALLVFTIAGPWVWTLDPAEQDLDQLSKAPATDRSAMIAEAYTPWNGIKVDVPTEPPPGAALHPVASISVSGTPTTQAVRLYWDSVPGAFGYRVYRSILDPGLDRALGLPLTELFATDLSFEDRLDLDARRYWYSVAVLDANGEELPEVRTIAIDVTRVITAQQAAGRGLVDTASQLKPGDKILLPMHPLGTDYLGRDMLSRLMHGARVSLFIGIVAPFFYVALGIVYGSVAGFLGGRVDQLLMRFADFVVALPFLLFMILLRIAFGIRSGESGIVPLLVALVLLSWPAAARLVRGQILQIRQEGYIGASRLLGARTNYLVLRHMIPNTMGVILVTLTFAVPSAIFTEAFLSFIGMGVAPPTPSWGSMCNEGIKTMLTHPHELILPALLISITVLAFNLLGDGLRDALDARMRSRE
jgi:oligopeptide transport system permease protein